MSLVPIKEEDKTKKYYKYYEQGIASPTKEQMELVINAKGKMGEGLEIEERNKVLEHGVHPEKFGYFPLKGGGLLVSGNVPMPDVTAEMLYWWFAWHSVEPFRYTIWNPEDHYGLTSNDVGINRSKDKNIPLEEKTWGATHTVKESIGGPADDIVIMFKNPEEMGYDMSKVGTDDCEFIVAANALLGPMKIPVVMTEVAKKINGEMTFLARFWVGYHIIDGEPKYLIPPGKEIPEEMADMVAKGLLAHNIKEFSNLNKILPSVYSENKDDV